MNIAEQMMQWRVVPDRLKYWADATPNAAFVKCDSSWLSYAEVELRSKQMAAGLHALGISKGSRVAIILPNRIEFILSIFGISKLGAIQVPLNPFLRGDFLGYQLADSGAVSVITDCAGLNEIGKIIGSLPSLGSVICVDDLSKCAFDQSLVKAHSFATLCSSGTSAPVEDLRPSDPIAILYTSGTTGMPKGCIMSHGYYMATPVPWFRCGWIAPGDRIFTAFPMFHASGNIMALMNSLQLGISVCYLPQFSASNFMRQAADEEATVVLGVGPMGAAILASSPSPADTVHKIRLCMWTPMDPANQLRFEQRFQTRVTAQAYGQTEINPVTMGPLDGPAAQRGSGGKATEFVELEVVDDDDQILARGVVGEIVMRPRQAEVMFQGYWQRPQATVEASRNLWHHTGDFGCIDEDGYLTFIDRKKDALRRRGENISSFELEKAILQHEKIAAVAVHAVPSPLGEDDVKACVVLKQNMEIEPTELFAWFIERLPYYAVPRYVEIMDGLPINAVGRVMKHVLRERGVEGAWDQEKLGLIVEKNQRRG